MKLYGTITLAAVASLAITLANKSTEDEINTINASKATEFKLDKKKSSLEWKGSKSEDYFHVGTVNFSEGELLMKDDEVMSGSFTLDMETIVVTDDMPEGKISYLTQHLQSEDFFNATKFPSVSVDVTGYKNGILSTTLVVMGVSLENEIAVKLELSEESVHLVGEFDIDFTSLNIPGMQVDEESGEAISSVVSYKLNLHLTK